MIVINLILMDTGSALDTLDRVLGLAEKDKNRRANQPGILRLLEEIEKDCCGRYSLEELLGDWNG